MDTPRVELEREASALGLELAPAVMGARRVFCCHRATLSGAHAPNSLPAVSECVEAAVPRLELDVRFLADDSMLIFHDRLLDHETNARGPVDALDRAAARDVRHRTGEPLCFIEEVVDILRTGSTLFQVDLKLMRPITNERVQLLLEALAPLGDRVLIGSQAHWNLRPLALAGLPVALDPTLHWHHAPGRTGEGVVPGRLGMHGLWDDAPLAHIRHASAAEYIHARVEDLIGILPAAREWMVDISTLQHIATLGIELPRVLAARGIEVAAWTMRDAGPGPTTEALRRLFAMGVTTVITDHARQLARYAACLA